MYEGFYIPDRITELMSYGDLQYYHYQLLQYLNTRFGDTSQFCGVYDYWQDLPESTDETPIQDGALALVNNEFTYNGVRYSNGGTVIYNDGEWQPAQETNVSYDAEWTAIGDGRALRKIFSIPTMTSIVLLCSQSVLGRETTDLIFYSNAGEYRTKTSLCTLMRDRFAIYHRNVSDLYIGTNSEIFVPNGNIRYKFKILYFSGNPKDIVWYNTDVNSISASNNVINNCVLCNADEIVIDKESGSFMQVDVPATGIVSDLDMISKSQYLFNNENVDPATALKVYAEGCNNGTTYVAEMSSTVAGFTLNYNGSDAITIDEPLYAGDKIVMTPYVTSSGSTSWTYKVYRSSMISHDNSVNITRTNDGWDLTVNTGETKGFVKDVLDANGNSIVDDNCKAKLPDTTIIVNGTEHKQDENNKVDLGNLYGTQEMVVGDGGSMSSTNVGWVRLARFKQAIGSEAETNIMSDVWHWNGPLSTNAASMGAYISGLQEGAADLYHTAHGKNKTMYTTSIALLGKSEGVTADEYVLAVDTTSSNSLYKYTELWCRCDQYKSKYVLNYSKLANATEEENTNFTKFTTDKFTYWFSNKTLDNWSSVGDPLTDADGDITALPKFLTSTLNMATWKGYTKSGIPSNSNVDFFVQDPNDSTRKYAIIKCIDTADISPLTTEEENTIINKFK